MPLSRLKPKSDSALVRRLLDEIDEAIRKGAAREDVFKTLQDEHGMTISFAGFCKALMRARAARGTSGPERPAPQQSKPQSDLDSAIQGQTESAPASEVDCAIQSKDAAAEGGGKRERILTSKDFSQVHSMDFSDLDDRYRK